MEAITPGETVLGHWPFYPMIFTHEMKNRVSTSHFRHQLGTVFCLCAPSAEFKILWYPRHLSVANAWPLDRGSFGRGFLLLAKLKLGSLISYRNYTFNHVNQVSGNCTSSWLLQGGYAARMWQDESTSYFFEMTIAICKYVPSHAYLLTFAASRIIVMFYPFSNLPSSCSSLRNWFDASNPWPVPILLYIEFASTTISLAVFAVSLLLPSAEMNFPGDLCGSSGMLEYSVI